MNLHSTPGAPPLACRPQTLRRGASLGFGQLALGPQDRSLDILEVDADVPRHDFLMEVEAKPAGVLLSVTANALLEEDRLLRAHLQHRGVQRRGECGDTECPPLEGHPSTRLDHVHGPVGPADHHDDDTEDDDDDDQRHCEQHPLLDHGCAPFLALRGTSTEQVRMRTLLTLWRLQTLSTHTCRHLSQEPLLPSQNKYLRMLS